MVAADQDVDEQPDVPQVYGLREIKGNIKNKCMPENIYLVGEGAKKIKSKNVSI